MPWQSRNTTLAICLIAGVTAVIAATIFFLQFQKPNDVAQKYISAISANDVAVVAELTDFYALRAFITRSVGAALPNSEQGDSLISTMILNAIKVNLDTQIVNASNAFVNGTTLTQYLQGVLIFVSAGQPLRVQGNELNKDLQQYVVTGGNQNKRLVIYFLRSGLNDWKVVALEHDY
jgi:hypothetical protein